MDQLNPGLRNLVNLGKSYEKAVTGTDFKLAKVCFSTSLGLTFWKHQTSLAVNCGNKAEVNICWLISLPYTLMFFVFAFPTQHQIQARTLDWAITSMCFSPSCAAMTLAGKAYFEAVSKLGENAIVSLVSQELGEFRAGPGSIVSGCCGTITGDFFLLFSDNIIIPSVLKFTTDWIQGAHIFRPFWIFVGFFFVVLYCYE